MAGTATMTDTGRNWEGKVVNGEFPLQQYLGGSDHGDVFLTQRSAADNQKAAIKIIPADPETQERQLLHWKVAGKLFHPHLLQIYESGKCEINGNPLLYVVMEYAEENLAQIIPQRPLTVDETREMVRPVLDALELLHGKGFVHGRVRPSNILASGDQIKLATDTLGPASEQLVNPGKNLPGKIAPYDAPETVGGKPTSASDIWSLGTTLVEAMTQRVPNGENRERVPNSVQQPFFEIARRCLRQNPQDRWTAAEISAFLQQPTPARKPAVAAAKPASSKWPLLSIVAGVIVLVLVIGSKLRTTTPEEKTPEVSAQSSKPTASEPVTASKPAPVIAPPVVKPNPTVTKPAEAKPVEAKAAPVKKLPAGAAVPGSVADQVLPNVSPSARATVTGKVRVSVKVNVDASGKVTDATFDSQGPSKYFASKSLEAAKNWKFTPPQVNGKPVASTWMIRFAIGSHNTDVGSSQTAP